MLDCAGRVYLEYEILSTVSEFFGKIRNVGLSSDSASEIDLGRVNDLLYGEEEELSQTERCSEALVLLNEARLRLYSIDAQLDAGRFRKVFESTGTPSAYSLELLLQYYFSKPERSSPDRDKIDLLATRWGSYEVPSSKMLRPAKGLESRIRDVYAAIGIEHSPSLDEETAVDTLEQFYGEILAIDGFRQVMENRIVNRLREYKAGLGEILFRPKVLAKIVEVNVAIHNLFQQLYDVEQARLHFYMEQAKEGKVIGGISENSFSGSLVEMMARAVQIDDLVERLKWVIANQQVVDKQFVDEVSLIVQRISNSLSLLISTLQRSIQTIDEQTERQRLLAFEKAAFPVSVNERQAVEDLAISLSKTSQEVFRVLFERGLVELAGSISAGKLNNFVKPNEEGVKQALSVLLNFISEGQTSSGERSI
ncbi:MAG: hypothetical protein RMM17_02935 [Acidobacteriota bacterium]|nr:hypothetical protein [Blastocatellia bacterium]MDW8411623.1 hypothetical protein [Acidobacteriota bacterium]